MKKQDYDHFAASLDEDAGLVVRVNSMPHRANDTNASDRKLTKYLAEASAREVVFINGTDLKPEPILWLWRDWLV